jgi:hypothetical protein
MHRLPVILCKPAHNCFSIGPVGNYEEPEKSVTATQRIEFLNSYGHGPPSFIGGGKIGMDIHQRGDLIIWLSIVGSATSKLWFSNEGDIPILSRLSAIEN